MFLFALVILKCVVICHGLFNIFQTFNNIFSQSLFSLCYIVVSLWKVKLDQLNYCTCQLYLSHKPQTFAENARILLENPTMSKGAL